MNVSLNIPDPLYAEIAQVAANRGQSVEALMVDQLEAGFLGELPDDFWTPERLAEIDRAFAEAKEGSGVSLEEAGAEIAERSRRWRAARNE